MMYKRGDVGSRYIPEGSREVADSESDAVVYLGERNGVPYGLAYCGKRARPDWNYRFRSEAQREGEVQRYFEGRRRTLAYKSEVKEARKNAAPDPHGYIGRPQVAAMIKRHLGREFPGVKFSVTSDSYSGGGCINIGWSDGPTRAQVEAIADEYSSKGFDGSIDMAYHYDHWLLPDGTAITASNHGGTEGSRGVVAAFEVEKPHPDARRVNLSSGYVSCDREVTEGAKEGIRAAWRALTPHERFKLYEKVRPYAGQYNGPGGWPQSFSLEDGELGDFTEEQRAHIVWAIARDVPLPAA